MVDSLYRRSGQAALEKVGRRSDAITLLAKRRHEKLLRKKLPEALRGRAVTFGDLADKARCLVPAFDGLDRG